MTGTKPKIESMSLGSFVKGLLLKILRARRWYLLPLWFLLVLLALILLFSGHGTVLPAIYMTF